MHTLAAGMTHDEFWRSTPYEWMLARRAYNLRMRGLQAIIGWHVAAIGASFNGRQSPPLPFLETGED